MAKTEMIRTRVEAELKCQAEAASFSRHGHGCDPFDEPKRLIAEA